MSTSEGHLFPPFPRTSYSAAPLLQVLCQLRFPAIIRIEKDLPADFQDRIRQAFPLYERANPLPPQVPKEVLQLFGGAGSTNSYHFLTEDRKTTVELTEQSLTLATQTYQRWERFNDLLRVPLSALNTVYQPGFFTRVGLRYQDLIQRRRLGLDNVPWSRLLRREVLGELAVEEFEKNVQGASRVLHMRMPSHGGTVVLRHGLGTAQGRDETGYVIDLDFSTEQKTEVSDVEPVLFRLHDEVGRAFNWCITKELHDALGPTELDPIKLDPINDG